MKIDQNQPGTWMGIGAVMMLAGVILRAAAPDVGIGWLLIVVGALLLLVGVVIVAIRAGTSGRPGDDGVG